MAKTAGEVKYRRLYQRPGLQTKGDIKAERWNIEGCAASCRQSRKSTKSQQKRDWNIESQQKSSCVMKSGEGRKGITSRDMEKCAEGGKVGRQG